MQLTSHGGRSYITDSLRDRIEAAVFPIFQDESIYLADHIDAHANDAVLDIGTGSGILAITAAVQAKHVLALDIQERALRFASFNAYVNGIRNNRISFVQTDGLAGIRGKFDLVLFNPPFNPAPASTSGTVFSHGGPDGQSIVRKVFSELPRVLNPRARMNMVSLSLGVNDRPLVFDLVESFLSQRAPRVCFTLLYPPTDHRDLSYFERIFGSGKASWFRRFDSLPRIFYVHLAVEFDSNKPGFYETPLTAVFGESEFAGTWEARIRRLHSIYHESL